MPQLIDFHNGNLLRLECERLTGHKILDLLPDASNPVQDDDIADAQEPPNGPEPQPLFIELEASVVSCRDHSIVAGFGYSCRHSADSESVACRGRSQSTESRLEHFGQCMASLLTEVSDAQQDSNIYL